MKVFRLFTAARTSIMRAIPLFRDARVPLTLKFIVAAIAVLIVSPIDIFGDIPVLGMIDDAALLTLLSMWFVHQAAKHAGDNRVAPGTAIAFRRGG